MNYQKLFLYALAAYIIIEIILRFFIYPARRAKRDPFNKKDPFLHYCLAAFNALYKGVSGKQIALEAKKQRKIPDDRLTYGEITFSAFIAMLKIANPKPGEIFYDLGCGAGKAVFAAALLHDFKKCYGVELLPPLYDLCEQLKNKFYQLPELQQRFAKKTFAIEFYNANFFDVDFSDADIVFINATCFIGEYWLTIIGLLDKLKVGSRIILSSRYLPVDRYKQLAAGDCVMSWGLCSVNIYEKTK